MKQVDFYLLSDEVANGQLKLASRLANKLQSLGQSTLIVTQTTDQLALLSETLWGFSDTSFVAHNEATSLAADCSRTHIAAVDSVSPEVLERNYDVLLTLSTRVPLYCHHFSRIAEVVDAPESAKQAARQRFKHYQTEGFELKTHNIAL